MKLLRYAFILTLAINSAHASTGVSCLIEARLRSSTNIAAAPQGLNIVNVANVIKVANDTVERNDFKDCATRFSKNMRLQFGSETVFKRPNGRRIWLNYIYGDDRGGSHWEHYNAITSKIYKERQNGLLR